MDLKTLKIENFRCFDQESSIEISDLTTIIGKNDIGKSTILEALDAFFNDKIDQQDVSKQTEENQVSITCIFSNIPDTMILDSRTESNPINEGLLNQNNELEITRIFKFSQGNRLTKETYLRCLHPVDEGVNKLLQYKNTPLKGLANDLGADLDDVNKAVNVEIREALRNQFETNDRQLQDLKVDGKIDNDYNIKEIWKNLKKYIPIYSLFNVDRDLTDTDTDIQDPMKVAIKEALNAEEVQELINRIEEKVKNRSTEVADNTINELKDIDENLSEEMRADFSKPPDYSKIFSLNILNNENIPLNKRGSGIRRLVLLSFFQAEAKRKMEENNSPSIIYGFEEPETSQHPNHQRMIIDALKNLSESLKRQVLFTTHSANLAKEIPVDAIRYLNDENGQMSIESGVDNPKVVDKVVDALGILPNPADKVKVLVYVEGKNDVEALKRYSRIISQEEDNTIDLDNTEAVGYVIAGGSSLKHYVENEYLKGLGKPEVHIYDNDNSDYSRKVMEINQMDDVNVAFQTSKLELENYLHPRAINEAYAENGLNLNLTEINDNEDVPTKVAIEVYDGDWDELSEEKRSALADRKKKTLNTRAVEKMNIERLKERNGYIDFVEWLRTIKSFI